MNTTIITKRNRQTGTLITVASAAAVGADTQDTNSRWFTICEDHGTAVPHSTRQIATEWASSPKVWCEDCRAWWFGGVAS